MMRQDEKGDPVDDKENAKSDAAPLELRGLCEADAAERLRDELIARTGADLEIDGAEVEILGALNAQLLAAAAKTWTEAALALRILNPSEALLGDLKLLGLFDVFTPHITEDSPA
ncbi:MAG: STAS domain-containing protein [Pseudomonadota bacterium]